MSMRVKAIILIIFIVFATTASTFISSLYFTNSSLEETVTQDLEFAIGIADSLVSTQMKLMKTEAGTIAARLSGASSEEEMSTLIAEQFNVYPDISALSVFDRGGIIASYSVPQHEHDLSAHSSYIEMAYAGATIISSPFYCSEMGEFVINVYTPMPGDRILSATMPGLIFSNILSQHRLWQSGDIFMLNEYGTFIGAADEEIVLAMNNYISDSESGSQQAGEEIRSVIHNILSFDNGVEHYRFEGVERLCAYSLIDSSVLGWRVAVTVPLNESPQANARRGQLYAAVFFLSIGVVAAFFLSRTVVRPFKRIEAQNRDLEKLNETIRAQASSILDEHERIRLMLDATPLACRLWSRDFKLLECNEAAVRMFGLRDKKEYIERYFELSPKYQPGGRATRDRIREVVSEAFERGACTYEWLYRTVAGVPIPSEITMVRVPYGDGYVVASYSRDLREQKKMMAEIEHRDALLDTCYRVSYTLFDTAEDDGIEAVLVESLELLGRCVDADQVYITQNELVNNIPHFTCKSAWAGGPANTKSAMVPGMRFPWGLDDGWDARFRQGECMNAPVGTLPESIQGFFAPFQAKSVLVIPVFAHEQFWGLVGFSDCRNNRFFGKDEVNILRSASLMMAIAVSRNEQAARLREIHHRTRLLTNATPLGFNLWDRNGKNIETNETSVKLFGLKDQQEYLDRFFDLSPEYQPDGRLSADAAASYINTAFKTGRIQFEWLHQTLDGVPLPFEVTLVRLEYGDDYVVAGYTRDLREYKKMLSEIDRRDYLRKVVNHAADLLLRTEPDGLSDTLQLCMGMMAGAINADRMYLFKNHTEDGRLYCTQLYEWSGEVRPFQNTDAATNISYDEKIPAIQEKLTRGEYVHSLVRDLSPAGQKWLGAQGILAVLFVPVYIQDTFWGFVGFDNCHSERLFTENEESIMRSGSLLIVNALLRNENMLRIRETSAKLEAALADAEEANNAKSNFLAHMSHEIRTPLNAVVGLSELILDEGAFRGEAGDKLEKIHDSGMTILSIVNDILDISKIESGKFELHPIRYDTPSLINDTVTLNIVRIGEKDIRFKICVDENLPGSLYGDDLRVKQIFNNLLSNAFKYTHSGTVEWQVEFQPDTGGGWLISSVRDTGIGIKQEDVQKLFSAYNQVDTKRNRNVEGTGLGLAITKRLVEMMGGDITVESEYGKGTLFKVRLRQEQSSGVAIGKQVAKNLMEMRYTLTKRGRNTKIRRTDLSYAHILIVDDIVTNLDVVKGMLKPYRMKVDCASSGPQAIDMIRGGSPRYSAVFMDHMMPGMDGVEATRVIREEIGTDYAKNIPIIALTANAIFGNEEMFLSKGFQAFISKPIDMMKLDFVLRQWVRDKSREKELEGASPNAPAAVGAGPNGPSLTPGGITLNGVDIGRALERFGGDETVLMDVLRSYATNTPPLLHSLREYIEAGNLAEYAIAVHGIKGSSYGIFAQTVGKAAEALETAARQGSLEAVKDGHQAFEQAAKLLLCDMRRSIDRIDEADGKPLAPEPDFTVLEELRKACAEGAMDRIDSAMARLEAFRYEKGERLMAWLRGQVSDMTLENIANWAWEYVEGGEDISFLAPDAAVLVVDDNETSRMAALGLLKPLQIQADTAKDGEEALRMLAKKAYHLVLMDCMMPVMDGIETTKKLRSAAGKIRDVPVIALISNGGGSEAVFRQAGVNDFLAKPVERSALYAKVRRWLPPQQLQGVTGADMLREHPSGSAASLEKLPVIRGINTLEGIRYSGGRRLFMGLLENFYRLIDVKASKIEEYLAGGMVREVSIEVHALKNSARMLGAMELSDNFLRLEQYGGSGDLEALRRETPDVLAQYRGFKPLLRPFGEPDEREKRYATKSDLKAVLKELAAAAAALDLDGTDGAQRRLEKLRIPAECKARMDALRAYVADVALNEAADAANAIADMIEQLPDGPE